MSKQHFIMAAAENLPSLCYMSDLDTYELLYLNKIGKNTFGFISDEQYAGEKCYRVLQNREEPCEFCTNQQLELGKHHFWEYSNPLIGRRYSLCDSLVEVDGKAVRMEIATDISDHFEQVFKLENKLTMEETLVRCVQTLSGSNTAIGDSVGQLLAIVGEYFQSKRAYIFEFDELRQTATNTYEWCATGVPSQIEKLQEVDIADISRWLELFEEKGEVFISNLHQDVENSSNEYQHLQQQGIERLIAVPFSQGGEFVGFIGVDDPLEHIGNVALLKSVAVFILDDLQKHRLLQHLEFLSYIDSLTGVYNRHKYKEQLQLLEKTRLQHFGVVHVDINGLREANDIYGQEYGDYIVISVAELMKKALGEDVYRISGDEFIAVLCDIEEVEFERRVALLRELDKQDPRCSFSVGSVWKRDGVQIAREVAYANELMYADKQLYYRDRESGGSTHRSGAVAQLLKELRAGQFTVYLQGKMNLKTGKISGAEALVRKFDEEGHVVPPLKFIPVYEHQRIIRHVDFFVLELVCQTIQSWLQQGQSIKIAVNFSRITMLEHDVVEHIEKICAAYQIPHHLIDLEITESTEKMDNDILERKIVTLKQLGFSISLDDFGTQYSNLSILTSMDFSEVKLDKSLVDDLCVDYKSRVIVNHSIQMIRNIGSMTSLAEGVETKEQCDLLREYGCDYIQGYYFLKPMPIEDFWQTYLNQL